MFSIVIPLYNKAHTIERTLSSVLNQTYANYEILIINDGSTDNGIEVIKKFSKDQRIKIINQENKGVSAARNKGIIEAKNEYIAFLDGDDEWLPLYLENLKESINSFPNAGLFLSGRFIQNFNSGVRFENVPRKYKNIITEIEFFQNPHVFGHISATTVKRELILPNLNSFGGFIEGHKSNEDFVFLFRIALHTQVVYIGQPLAIYNGDVTGQATKELNDYNKLYDSIKFHNVVFEEWEKSKCENKYFEVFMKYEIRHLILMFIKNSEFEKLSIFVSKLNKGYKYFFYSWEWQFYEKQKHNRLMICFILFSKLIWRTHNYPRVK